MHSRLIGDGDKHKVVLFTIRVLAVYVVKGNYQKFSFGVASDSYNCMVALFAAGEGWAQDDVARFDCLNEYKAGFNLYMIVLAAVVFWPRVHYTK